MEKAPLGEIFFSQCIDHAVGLIFASWLVFCGMSLFDLNLSQDLLDLGPLFWLGALGTLGVASFICRTLSTLFWGATLGNRIMRLEAAASSLEVRYWLGQLLESLHLALPALWLIELLDRAGWGLRLQLRQGGLGLNYTRRV